MRISKKQKDSNFAILKKIKTQKIEGQMFKPVHRLDSQKTAKTLHGNNAFRIHSVIFVLICLWQRLGKKVACEVAVKI